MVPHALNGNVLIPLIMGHVLIPGALSMLTVSYNNGTGFVYINLNGIGREVSLLVFCSYYVINIRYLIDQEQFHQVN